MNVGLQIGKLGRMVPQLGDPLLLLILQLLLHLPQHLVNVLHNKPALSLHTHFHTPPAILVVRIPISYARITLLQDPSCGRFSGIGPSPTPHEAACQPPEAASHDAEKRPP